MFADPAEAELVDRHRDDLELEQVCAIFAADLRRRGVDAGLDRVLERVKRVERDEHTNDPLTDADFIAALSDVYPRSPTVFPEL